MTLIWLRKQFLQSFTVLLQFCGDFMKARFLGQAWQSGMPYEALGLHSDEVGCIDGTPHQIYRPEVEPQWKFYSGYRHYHLMNTQLIVDSLGNIVFLQAGSLGAMNDAGNFHLMERIGPGTNNDMPHGVVLLADKGYGKCSAPVDTISCSANKTYAQTPTKASKEI